MPKTCKSGKDSTLKERDLLEISSGEIELMNGAHSIGKYHLDAEGISTRGIGDFARYLLIPARKSAIRGRWCHPHVTLWPSSRRSVDGPRTRYSELLLDMAGLTSVQVEPKLRAIKVGSEWERLVDDLLQWAQTRPMSTRFSGFPVAVSSEWQFTRQKQLGIHRVSRVIHKLQSALPSQWQERLTRTLAPYAAFVARPGSKHFPPDQQGDREQTPDGGGMLIVHIELLISGDDHEDQA
jgi:hypothetical protein